jgi:hypothetical protein
MPVDLGGALVGWVVSLLGDSAIRLVRRSSDERDVSKAMELAISKVVEQADSTSQDVLRSGLRECFSAPPRLELDATTSVSTGLRAAIAAQVDLLDRMVHGDTRQPFYQVVAVDRTWLVERITETIIAALRQVAATSGLVELVRGMDTADLLAAIQRDRPETKPVPLTVRVREAQPQLLGVHRAIHTDGAGGFLPSYVLRDTDIAARGVRALISAAAEHGGSCCWSVARRWARPVAPTRPLPRCCPTGSCYTRPPARISLFASLPTQSRRLWCGLTSCNAT